MRGFLRFISMYPIATCLAVAVMVLAGIYSAWNMPVDLFPNLKVPVVNIISHFPGAAPEDIELLVSRPIEDEIRSIPGVRRVASTSIQGVSQVTAEFGWGTTVRDVRQLVQAKLSRLRGVLPPSVSPRLEDIGTTLQEVCGYVVYGGIDMVSLRNTVNHDIAGRLMSVEGVSSVEVLGGDRRAFYVKIRPEDLSRVHRSVSDIVSILKRHNVSVVAGYLEHPGREYLVRGDARLRTIDDIRSLPVIKKGEQSILLGSIADVYEGHSPRHYVVHGDGLPAVAMIIRKQPGKSTIRVVSDIDKTISGLHNLLPPGASLKKFYDQSQIIIEAQNEILNDLIIGAVLAVLVLYFFLGSLRPTLVIALTIPITLLATVGVMHLFGLGFNVITMTAMVLAIGMIVDDAIVVAENIYRHGKISSDRMEASVQGAAEIAGPDASGTFTTVGAFLPLILVTGLAALFLRPFGLTVSAALLVSLLLSLTMVPVLFSRIPLASVPHKDFPGARLLRKLNKTLQAALRFTFRHKWVTLGLALLFLCASALTGLLGGASILPPIDEGSILIEYVMPAGTSLTESNRIGCALDRIALSDPDVSCVYRRTGSPETGYQIEGVNKGELLISLKSKTERRRSGANIMASLKKSYSQFRGVVFLYHQPTQEKIDESFSGLPALFGVTIYGTDTNTLTSLADEVENLLSRDPAITNVVNNTKIKASQIDVRVDYEKLAQYGIDLENLLNTLQATSLGVKATHIIRQKEDIAVLVKMDVARSPDIGCMRKLPLVTSSGAIILLSRIADIRIRHTPAAITRINGQREITLLAEVAGSIPSVVSRLHDRFQSMKLPKGYSIDFSGQYKALIETAIEMLFTVAAAIVLIYLIMVMQFGSWLQPLVILFTIPFSLVGALIALFITGHGLDVSVGMGTVTLVGIAVNNAIVLMDYANRRVDSGKNMGEALLSAATVRLRPILLTTFTTIFALLPAAIGTTVGSQIFRPFAVTVIGGLISGVIATLVVVPTLAAMVGYSGHKHTPFLAPIQK